MADKKMEHQLSKPSSGTKTPEESSGPSRISIVPIEKFAEILI
jgi:hypothetical protein